MGKMNLPKMGSVDKVLPAHMGLGPRPHQPILLVDRPDLKF